MALYKLLQRQTYTCLSHKYGTILCIGGVLLTLISAFQFGEVALDWSRAQYEAIFNVYTDNLAGTSFQDRMCLPIPIDIVYTWVNGSDPDLIENLKRVRTKLEGSKGYNDLSEHRRIENEQFLVEDNSTNRVKCKLKDCVPSKLVVLNISLGASISLEKIIYENPILKSAYHLFNVTATTDAKENYTVINFLDHQSASIAARDPIVINGKNITASRGYLTSDWTAEHSILLKDTVLMTGLGKGMTPESVGEKIPQDFRDGVAEIDVNSEDHVAILSIPDLSLAEDFLVQSPLLYHSDGKIQVVGANLVWLIHKDHKHSEDIAANRFEDNEELRYSLRSIERFAPWVRHVYVVTNGQIPSWLNLDSARITLVTHKEIFPNSSHLPTFSSPAIESHLHQIPGLSEKFIYLNDDVMFGQDVWPDDFFTHSRGQKVYLTWPVPNCNEGCPQSWIKDGYCDKPCNVSECEWDGGDCAGTAGQQGGIRADGVGLGGFGADSRVFCSAGCSNGWVADKYCDQVCNNYACGFDAGDCGTDNFPKLYSVAIKNTTNTIKFPQGTLAAYFNLTLLYGPQGSITEGKYENNDIIRTATVAKKFNTVNVLLYNNHTETTVLFYLVGKDQNDTIIKKSFNMTVSTLMVKETAVSEVLMDHNPLMKNETKRKNETKKIIEEMVFMEIPVNLRSPKIKKNIFDGVYFNEVSNNLEKDLPEKISNKLSDLEKQYNEGELTEKGYKKLRANILKEYMDSDLRKVHLQNLKEKGEISDKEVIRSDDKHQQGHQNVKFNVLQPAALIHDNGVENTNLKKVNSEQQKDMRQMVNDNNHLQHHENMSDISKEQRGGPAEKKKPHFLVDARKNDTFQQKMTEFNHAYLKKNVSKNDPNLPNINQDHLLNKFNISSNDKLDHNPNRRIKYERDLQQNISYSNQLKNDKHGFNKLPGRRKLMDINEGGEMEEILSEREKYVKLNSFLPWERTDLFRDSIKEAQRQEMMSQYQTGSLLQRRPLDTFGDSLRHVNTLFNQKFGVDSRRVPAHMPHMIDKSIMQELQNMFPEEFVMTSSHQIRHPQDMQFAFSYFYFLIHQTGSINVSQIFDDFDVDHSGILSDREIRTLATRIFDPPLDLLTLQKLENVVINCSLRYPNLTKSAKETGIEQYYDEDMPLVTKSLVLACDSLSDKLKKTISGHTKYRHETFNDEDIAFKMIRTNVSHVIGQLDDIRRNPKKFICLNDNIDHSQKESHLVKAVLNDFYEGIFPIQSQFELPAEYRNRFLHIDELNQWREWRDWMKFWTQVTMAILVMVTLGSFFSNQLMALKRRLLPARRSRKLEHV